MDWGSKMAAWDLAELEPNAEPNLSKSRAKADEMDFRVDLKLGGSDDLGAPETWRDQPPISIEISSSSPSKRARAPSSGGGCYNASCLVDGCKADLSACREYHRRHKVCEMHSKTPVVVVGGVEQRFCQQCSRFHLLVEFDEVKRSCRKRLDGHNRRRRKPQPDSISSANLFPIQQGARFSTYSLASQTHPVQHNWAGILKEEDDAPFSFSSPISSTSNQQHVPGSFFQRYKEGEPITLIQDNKTVCGAAVEQSTYQPSVKTLSSEISQSRIFSDGINLDSDCALSLLSSPADGIPMGQPYVLNFQYSRLEQYPVSQASRNLLPKESSSGLQEEQVGVLVCDTDADLQCQSMFHVGGESSSDGPSESLPFSWH